MWVESIELSPSTLSTGSGRGLHVFVVAVFLMFHFLLLVIRHPFVFAHKLVLRRPVLWTSFINLKVEKTGVTATANSPVV